MSPDPDQLIAGRYRVEKTVGRGGMSTVYRAHDESLGRLVALKVLDVSADDAEGLAREHDEIRLLASLNHHGLVTLFDAMVAEVDGVRHTILVMEFVDGPDLADRLADAPMEPAQVASMAKSLADALQVIHGAGIVHRDIKPGNVLLAPSSVPGEEFEAKLADLGIARLVDSAATVTTSMVVGTAAYISPERLTGAAARPAGDIYSLGLVLLEALTGSRAFPGPTAESLQSRLWRDPEIPGSIGYGWKSLLTAMTARDVESRPTARELSALAAALILDEGGPWDDTTASLEEQLAPTRVLAPVGASAETEIIDRPVPLATERPRRRLPKALVPAAITGTLIALAVVVTTAFVGPAISGNTQGSTPTPGVSPAQQITRTTTPSPTSTPTVPAEKGGPGKGKGNKK